MATDTKARPTGLLSTSAQPDTPLYTNDSDAAGATAVLDGATLDHSLADKVAAATETPAEAEIDARMGLRGAKGREPRPEDFTDVLSPEGNSGGIAGADISDSPFVFGEDGSTRIP